MRGEGLKRGKGIKWGICAGNNGSECKHTVCNRSRAILSKAGAVKCKGTVLGERITKSERESVGHALKLRDYALE